MILGLGWLMVSCGGAGGTPPSRRTTTGAGAATVATSSITYVAIGASDAYGIGTDDPDRLNWPAVLAHQLGPSVHLVNVAIPGATVSEAMRAEIPVALAVHPNIVTIWLAVNDLADGVNLRTYVSELTATVNALRQGSQARIFVGNVPDLTLVPYFSADDPAALATQVHAWNVAIAGVCQSTGSHLVDLMTAWKDLGDHPEYISSDGLHPSTVGAERIADAFASSIHAAATP